ncbi:hypothetical protein D3C72_1695850 [compost metagenome]
MVDKDDAVSVVDFVLNDTGKESFGAESNFITVNIKSFDANLCVTWYFAVDVADAETAFVVIFNLAFVFYDLWIDESSEITTRLVVKVATNNNGTFEAVNLYGGESGADFMWARVFPIKCGRRHIVDEFNGIVCDDVDFC